MKPDKNTSIKNILVFFVPVLPFLVLLVPYSLVKQWLIVDWLGCGCPKLDEFGNVITPDFNANDFTTLFWLFITICATVISVFLSKRIPRDKKLLKVLYVAGIFVISLFISYQFCQIMRVR